MHQSHVLVFKFEAEFKYDTLRTLKVLHIVLLINLNAYE